MAELFDYEEARADAIELIAEFGAPAILRKQGWMGGPPEARVFSEQATFPVRAVDLGQRQVWNGSTLIRETTRTIFISTEGLLSVDGQRIEPEKDDEIAIVGERGDGGLLSGVPVHAKFHAIEEFYPLAPAGLVVMWEIKARL